MGVPRVFSKTPLFLHPLMSRRRNAGVENDPFVTALSRRTPLFRKGRDCLAFLLRVFRCSRPDCDEVVIPAYAAQSLVFAALHEGLKIRLVDIDLHTFFPAYDSFKSVLNERTLAVFLPYNWGVIPDLSELKRIHELCLSRQVYWVDDLATTVPTGAYNQYLNETSQCLFFSYGKTKIISIMDGGCAYLPKNHPYYSEVGPGIDKSEPRVPVSAWDMTAARRIIENLSYHFYATRAGYSALSLLGVTAVERPPTSIRVDEEPLNRGWEYALGDIIERYYSRSTAWRQKIFNTYHDCMCENTSCSFMLYQSTKSHIGSRFPILFATESQRDEARRMLNKAHVGATLGYIWWLGEVPILKQYMKKYHAEDFPNALRYQKCFLTLPANEKVTERDVVKIIGMLRDL